MSKKEKQPLKPCCGPQDAPPLTRRTFVKVAMGGAFAAYTTAFCYPLYRYLATPAKRAAKDAAVKEVDLVGAEQLPVNSAMYFKFAGKPSLLIHHPDGSWTAMTAVCTHVGCTVQYEKDKERIHCACHGGTYDAKTGKNISGPPPKPLKIYNVQIAEGKVTVSRA